jgi:hypothetical protein
MSIRQLAQRLAGVEAGFRRTERHVREELDESVTGIRHLDPDSAMRLFGYDVDAAPETAGEIADQMQNEMASTDQRQIDGHGPQVYSRIVNLRIFEFTH